MIKYLIIDEKAKKEIESIIVQENGPFSALEFFIKGNYYNLNEIVEYMKTIRYMNEKALKNTIEDYKEYFQNRITELNKIELSSTEDDM
jgi:hypothetical protein